MKLILASWISWCSVQLATAANLKCGYWTCPETHGGLVNLHLVPYWRLESVGSPELDATAGASISAVINELAPDSPRRFSLDQVAYLARWWEDQNVSSRTRLRRLVDSGRLEPVGGSWAQGDEATPHYSALLDALTVGLRWLQESLGECARPRVGWQSDTRGHSIEWASMLAQAGLQGVFLAALPENLTHFVWKADLGLGDAGEIFGASTQSGWPEGFCFDVDCPGDKITVANGMAKARNFIRHYTSKPRRTNQVLVPLGGDYQSASYSFHTIDNLIRYVNAKHRDLPKARAFYSTPSCFLRALLETNESWEEVDEDLFPYAERGRNSTDVAFWTGYFSGQPDLKKTLRRANGVLQACKQLSVLGSVYSNDVRALQEAVAFGQHHEIITYVSSSNPFEAVGSPRRTAEFKATAFTSGEPGPRKRFIITVRFC
ncbi:lysosomal alpha-mannosidase-like [Ixodes scapularis]|uniref:lysosomal alpha-mannosidase-like n=1 Tax=Ixodes scapularis TaxID=6945 RepID=UPI001AD79203|nr:lysosomal alpha-mannosidase-like [Ixodes scapularis]